MRKLIGTLALAGGILILSGIATPALAADVQGGEPSVSTSTSSPGSTQPTPVQSEAPSAPTPSGATQTAQAPVATGPSVAPSTEPSQPTDQKTNKSVDPVTTSTASPGSGSSAAPDTGKGHTPVTLCHKPGTPAEHTLTVDDDAVPAHLAHGDYLGECKPSTPITTPTPTITVTPPTGAPPVGVDSQTSVSYDCTTGMATKTLTETPYTWSRNDDGTYTKVPGTPVVTSTVRPIDPEEYTCPVNTPTSSPTEPTTPGTPPSQTPVPSQPSTSPTTNTPPETTTTNTSDGVGQAQSTVTNPRTALADTGSDTTGTIPAAGITLIICGLLALLVAVILKRRNGDGDAD